MGNTFGTLYRLTTFGESHGPAMGGVVDGMPAGFSVDMDAMQRYVDRRRPARSSISSGRNEYDRVELLSGLYQGRTLGTPVGFIVRNSDARSEDYERLRDVFRPSHADYTYQMKYGIRDYRGGGRASARETVCRMVGGALAAQALATLGITVTAYTAQIGGVSMPIDLNPNLDGIEQNDVRCPDADVARQMLEAIERARSVGDTLGGKVCGMVVGVPPGLGEPVFGKLSAALAGAMFSIPAVKSFDLGGGRTMAGMLGSETLDTMFADMEGMRFSHNYSGGIQGGISNGNTIFFEVGFKPIATLQRDIDAIDAQGRHVTLLAGGRHDVCAVPRAVPIVEAMAAMVLLDHYLLGKVAHL